MNLELWDYFGGRKSCLITKEICYLYSTFLLDMSSLPKDYSCRNVYSLGQFSCLTILVMFMLGLWSCFFSLANCSILLSKKGKNKKLYICNFTKRIQRPHSNTVDSHYLEVEGTL